MLKPSAGVQVGRELTLQTPLGFTGLGSCALIQQPFPGMNFWHDPASPPPSGKFH